MPSPLVLFSRHRKKMSVRPGIELTRPVIRSATIFLALWLWAESSAGERASAGQIQLRSAPDDSAVALESIGAEDIVAPVAESIGAGATRWYLVKTKTGYVGWIKAAEIDATKLESFFRRVPQPPVSIGTETGGSDTPRKAVVVPVHVTGTAVIVPVTLNRKLRTYMILDTGATFTVVSRQLAAGLNLRAASHTSLVTANGVIRVPLARLDSLRVADAEATDLTVAIHDFAPNPHIGGLLGLNYLSRFQTSLDSRRNELTLAPR